METEELLPPPELVAFVGPNIFGNQLDSAGVVDVTAITGIPTIADCKIGSGSLRCAFGFTKVGAAGAVGVVVVWVIVGLVVIGASALIIPVVGTGVTITSPGAGFTTGGVTTTGITSIQLPSVSAMQ